VVYTLTNPSGSSIDYEVSLDPGGTAPMLINGGTSTVSGTLAPAGGSTMVTVSVDATAAAALAMGSYSTDVIFDDTTNSHQLIRTHTIEAGLTSFDVTPASALDGAGPNGGPFLQNKVYTVTSTQPNPVSVQCTASDSWISLDGGAGPVSFILNGVGDSHAVTVAFSAAANSLNSGFYTGSVSFANLSGGTGDTSRDVTLDAGRLTISSADTPVPIADNSDFYSYINVADDLTIGDLNVKIDITHTFIGDLIVEIESPTGTIIRLHDRTGGSTDNLITTYDDSTNAPDGPGLLADVNGQSAQGTWTLHGSDNAGGDTGQLNSWALQIGAATLPPPDCIADLDGNGTTDVLDFAEFVSHFGTSVTPGTNGDFDSSGTVDVLDFAAFAANFGCPN
jgi:subtilisin-like proprotein convertase family protein